MITLQVFLVGLLITSTFTSLTTEAIKIVLAEHNRTYYSNTLAGIISVIISAAVGIGYAVMHTIPFGSNVVVHIIALAFMSWLCAMVGYDKVVQAITQFNNSGKDEENE